MTKFGPEHVVEVPGSKSISNRALICAALATGSSNIANCAPGDDTEAMIESLRRLGVTATSSEQNIVLSGSIDLENPNHVVLDAKLAGTTSRFLTALAALRRGQTTVDGGESLRSRPMGQLHDALAEIGAFLETTRSPGHLPVTVSRGVNMLSAVKLGAEVSSQFTSALMMVAPYLPNGLEISLGNKVVSRGYIEMTVGVMRAFGARVDFSDNHIWVAPGRYSATEYSVEPDASSASYPFAACAISGGDLTVKGLSRASLQGDVAFVDVLAAMGCQVSQTSAGLRIRREKSAPLKGIDVDMSQISDCVPTLAVVALFATTPTEISGVGFIRGKESDRIADLAHELRKLGAIVRDKPDGLRIEPGLLAGASLMTHHDHRLAMAFALAQREIANIILDDPKVVAKSWPRYFAALPNFYK
ncbi:MAG: 3-phosphoshikimate 1-carboxyvinyltransferase [Actinomycetota bacterium]